MGFVRGVVAVGVLGALGYGIWIACGGEGIGAFDALAGSFRSAFVSEFDPNDLEGTSNWWGQKREAVIAAAQSGNMPRLEAVTQEIDAEIAAIPRGELRWAMEVALITQKEVVVSAWVPREEGLMPLMVPSSVMVAESARQVEGFMEMPLAGPPAITLRIGTDISREFALGLQRGDWIETTGTICGVEVRSTPMAMHLVVFVKDVACR